MSTVFYKKHCIHSFIWFFEIKGYSVILLSFSTIFFINFPFSQHKSQNSGSKTLTLSSWDGKIQLV